ncbi:hypothetical protein EVAR_16756_1 [Eumeta japonica]|uniref:Uncharacterized protein n=1 Tax=Eumeta variegata TaxID=151549 RepID=A0A4C1ULW0_EUMVA|nr:hypothetical protein EVAR_16756_1 [Eumeta japonica]
MITPVGEHIKMYFQTPIVVGFAEALRHRCLSTLRNVCINIIKNGNANRTSAGKYRFRENRARATGEKREDRNNKINIAAVLLYHGRKSNSVRWRDRGSGYRSARSISQEVRTVTQIKGGNAVMRYLKTTRCERSVTLPFDVLKFPPQLRVVVPSSNV